MTGFSPFFRHCVLSLAFAAQVFAISDENTNGLSDVWERLFNSGQLFSGSNPAHSSTADPDGDSWTNATEAIAGTNPFVSQPPNGRLAKSVLLTSDQITLRWPSIAGKLYRIQSTSDLSAESWQAVSPFLTGTDSERSHSIPKASDSKLFFRIVISDQDQDQDTLNDWEERRLGTNPSSSDSDNDQMPDAWEIRYSLNPNNASDAAADANGDGITNLQSFLNSISPIGSGGNPATPIEPELVMRGQYTSSLFTGDALSWLYLSYDSESLVRFHYPTVAGYLTGDGSPPYFYIEDVGIGSYYSSAPDSAGISIGVFKAEPLSLWSLFPMPNASPDEDFSSWKKFSTYNLNLSYLLGFSEKYDDWYGNVVRSHYQFGLRLKQPAQQAITQTRTFLKLLEKSPYGTSNKTTTLLNPATQTMEFTIPVGKKASNVIDIHGPIPETAPEAGLSKRAYLVPVDLDIVHPATGELAEDREDGANSNAPDGGYISIKRTVGSDVIGDEDVTPITKLKIHAIAGAQNTWKTRVKFSGADRFKIYKDEERTEEVLSEQTEFDATQTTTLHFQGLKKSLSRGGESITMQVKIGDEWVDGDSVKCTIVQSEFLIQIKAFIPYEWTEGEYIPWPLPDPVRGKVAHGDNRDTAVQYENKFSNRDSFFSVAPFRLCHEVILTPYVDLHFFYQDIEEKRQFTSAPSSDHYIKATSVNPAELELKNGYLPLTLPIDATGPPVLSPATYSPELSLYNSLRANKCALDLTGSGRDGALGIYTDVSPAIDWDVRLEIDSSSNPLQPSFRVRGRHDLYPAYEIITLQADSTFKDTHRHMPARNELPGPASLSTAPSITFDNTGTISN